MPPADRHGACQRYRAEAEDAAVVVDRLRVLRVAASAVRRGAGMAVHPRRRDLGHHVAGRLGLRHRKLCLVGRHGERRDDHLRAVLPDPVGVAERHQPHRRVDDGVLRRVRRHHAGHPSRALVVCVLAVSLSQHDGNVAAVPQSAVLGLRRDPGLCHRICLVLVRRADPGHGDAEGPGDGPRTADLLRHPGAGLAGIVAALAGIQGDISDPGGLDGAAGLFGPQHRRAGLRGRADARLARDPVSALLHLRRRPFGVRRRADAGDPAAASLWASTRSSRNGISTSWRG